MRGIKVLSSLPPSCRYTLNDKSSSTLHFIVLHRKEIKYRFFKLNTTYTDLSNVRLMTQFRGRGFAQIFRERFCTDLSQTQLFMNCMNLEQGLLNKTFR